MNKKKVQVIIFYNATNGKKVFLLLQMNKKRNLLWQNITGGVDDEEDFEAAAIRESIEETALKSDNIKSINLSALEFKFVDQWNNQVFEKVFFITTHSPWEVQLDPTEHCSYQWVSEEEITASSVHYQSNYQALQEAIHLL